MIKQLKFINETTIMLELTKPMSTMKLLKDKQDVLFKLEGLKGNAYHLLIERGLFEIDAHFELDINDQLYHIPISWQFIDRKYSTDELLGLFVENDQYGLNFFSPQAQAVSLLIYDRNHSDDIRFELPMIKKENLWTINNLEEKTNIDDLTNYYYHIKVERFNETFIVLDPYAKSLAPWNGFDEDYSAVDGRNSAKAAFVNPSVIGPNLDYASIDDYRGSQDAIIYEVSVRDFTSSPSLEGQLNHPFGTFSAFIEKLDYIASLGITHIQLLPIMSFYNINEDYRTYREEDVSVVGPTTNYNWGYDPHSYFSLSGVYSTNVYDASLRIAEFKELIAEIHKRKMGVILDVVYNHTAKLSILEDIQPHYYHFMESDNTPKGSFGGGRLASTHKMAARIMEDSLLYFTQEFKVDGFRFDMMGDHDAQTIDNIIKKVKTINPNALVIGEGWISYVGDDHDPQIAADQKWISHTKHIGVFSDEYRNELKSGFPNEGSPQFLTNKAVNIKKLYSNMLAQPTNFNVSVPSNVVSYLEAHDNLTLHDVITISLNLDPLKDKDEIVQRLKLAHFILFLTQGTIFLQAGQEIARTRQIVQDDYLREVKHMDSNLSEDVLINKGKDYPYFIANAYHASDAINRFDWMRLEDEVYHSLYTYTKDLINFRRTHKHFHMESYDDINKHIECLSKDKEEALQLVFRIWGDKEDYILFINADSKAYDFECNQSLMEELHTSKIIINNEGWITSELFAPSLIVDQQLRIPALSGILLKTEK